MHPVWIALSLATNQQGLRLAIDYLEGVLSETPQDDQLLRGELSALQDNLVVVLELVDKQLGE